MVEEAQAKITRLPDKGGESDIRRRWHGSFNKGKEDGGLHWAKGLLLLGEAK